MDAAKPTTTLNGAGPLRGVPAPFEVRNVIAPADDASAPEIEITNAIPTVIPENLFDDGEDSNGEGVRRERLDDAGKNLRGN
jgi:hypothetical protein